MGSIDASSRPIFSPMPTLLAFLEYDGSAFFGSQIQKEEPSVALALQRGLKSMGIASKVRFSGRTDRGVHATRQAVSFEVPYKKSDWGYFKEELNKKLFPYLRVRRLYPIREGLDPRFEAKSRAYRYLLSEEPLSAFASRYVTHARLGDECKIQEAMKLLVGWHDFALFKKRGSQEKSTLREMRRCWLYRYQSYWVFYFEANGFLRLQIRLLVGALLKVGRGEMSLEEFKEQLEAKRRFSCEGAPPYGLYLCKVSFESSIWEVRDRNH